MLRVLIVASLMFGAGAFAQSQPQFEVAAITPAAPDAHGTFVGPLVGGRFNVTNLSTKELIVLAWSIQPFRVIGGPKWIDSARYDIAAEPENRSGPEQFRLMVQSLLEDRFQLKFHRETKELPVYALMLANKDGKLGPKLTLAKSGACRPPDPIKPPPPEPGKPLTLGCGGITMSPRSLTAGAVLMSNVARILSRILGRTVIDKTGLNGKYDINLQWTPDQAQLAPFAGAGPRPPGLPGLPPPDPNGPSIFTALQEQLGLKLESEKGPVELFVIDSVQRPSPN